MYIGKWPPLAGGAECQPMPERKKYEKRENKIDENEKGKGERKKTKGRLK